MSVFALLMFVIMCVDVCVVVYVLIQRGAQRGHTAYDIAFGNGHVSIATILRASVRAFATGSALRYRDRYTLEPFQKSIGCKCVHFGDDLLLLCEFCAHLFSSQSICAHRNCRRCGHGRCEEGEEGPGHYMTTQCMKMQRVVAPDIVQ